MGSRGPETLACRARLCGVQKKRRAKNAGSGCQTTEQEGPAMSEDADVDHMMHLQGQVNALVAECEDLRRQLAEADDWIREATKAITGLTPGGSEYFGRRVRNVYRADLPFCVQRIRERFEFERRHGAFSK
jgi:hypothetical protein